MSQYTDSGTKGFVSGTTLTRCLRVKLSAGTVVVASASEVAIGATTRNANTSGDAVDVALRSKQGTVQLTASVAITAGNAVYAAASGKVAATGTIYEGVALTTASADGDIIEVLWSPNVDIAASISGTSAAAFEVDNDGAYPSIELAAQTGGTGDYKATIKPPSTLTAARVFTLDGDAAATIANIGGAQTLTSKTLGTGTKDLRDTQTLTPDATNGANATMTAGFTQYTVTTVTNDANDWVTLPAIGSVGIGHKIVIAANAGTNFELRTPATTNTKINDVDADGSQEYLCTDTDTIEVTKRTTTGWSAVSYTKLGAVRTAVIPD